MTKSCPECDAILKAGKCPACGWKEKKEEKLKADAQCKHEVSGNRCPMAASWFPRGGDPGLCTWHREVEKLADIDTPEEFERFCLKLKALKYCTVWTHYEPAVLWDFLHHKVRNTPVKRACERPNCPFARAVHAPAWPS